MEQRIYNLKTEFNNISLIRDKINNIFDSLKGKMDKLKLLYSEFIKNSKSQLFVFGLDSFHFQSKMIDLEYDDMLRMFLAINNRMYCEYFKLYKIIISYISENISDKKIIDVIKGNNFPVYKDVEPFKDYKFEIIIEVHENILILLNSIMSIVNHRENELSLHKNKQLIGLNIDNFVNSFNFEIVIMKEKVGLFLSYIEFFHKMHAKYLERFNNKILLMYNNINSDIHFDDNNVSQDKKKEELKLEINNNDETYVFHSLDSGMTTPSNVSYKTSQNETSKHKTSIVPSLIKRGFKKMNNMINGCSTNKAIVNDADDEGVGHLDIMNYEYLNTINNVDLDDGLNKILGMEDIYNEPFKNENKTTYYEMMPLTVSNVDEDGEVVENAVIDNEIIENQIIENQIIESQVIDDNIINIVNELISTIEMNENSYVDNKKEVEITNEPKIVDNIQKKKKKKKNK